MPELIALLRGVNVGGHNKLPMKALRGIFEAHKATDVATYIQSGNVVFNAPKAGLKNLDKKLVGAIEVEFGFRVPIRLIERDAFRAIVDKNPFADDCANPSTLFVLFLPSRADKKALLPVRELLEEDEAVDANGAGVYFNAPSGVARSKAVEKLMRVFPDGTMRNWRTCLKLVEMAEALG